MILFGDGCCLLWSYLAFDACWRKDFELNILSNCTYSKSSVRKLGCCGAHECIGRATWYRWRQHCTYWQYGSSRGGATSDDKRYMHSNASLHLSFCIAHALNCASLPFIFWQRDVKMDAIYCDHFLLLMYSGAKTLSWLSCPTVYLQSYSTCLAVRTLPRLLCDKR